MKRFEIGEEQYPYEDPFWTMVEESHGEYVRYEEVCSFLKELLNCDLATLIERIEEEIKNA